MFSSQIYCVTFVNHRCTGGFTYFALHFIHATFCIEPRIAEIQEERTKELAFEGHRWFDLRRTTRPRIEKVIDGKTYILEKDDARYTLRIPQAAIDANPELQH